MGSSIRERIAKASQGGSAVDLLAGLAFIGLGLFVRRDIRKNEDEWVAKTGAHSRMYYSWQPALIAGAVLVAYGLITRVF